METLMSPALNRSQKKRRSALASHSLAKITTGWRVTIPAAIRSALGLAQGDLISWQNLPDGSARVRRVVTTGPKYLDVVQSSLAEWSSPTDEEAYREL
jgi:SpoVT / AbrB like domain.